MLRLRLRVCVEFVRLAWACLYAPEVGLPVLWVVLLQSSPPCWTDPGRAGRGWEGQLLLLLLLRGSTTAVHVVQ